MPKSLESNQIATEYEINYYFIDKDTVRNNLVELGACLVSPEQIHKRVIFDLTKDGKDKIENLVETNTYSKLFYPVGVQNPEEIETFVKSILFADYTRVRNEGQKITMSTKIHAAHGGVISDQKESCLEISSFRNAVSFLESLGLHQRAYQENQREIWSLNGVHIQIDTWPGMPSYVEIEGSDEAGVCAIAQKLNFDKQIEQNKIKSTIASVSHLYSEYFGIDPDTMLAEPIISFGKLPKWARLKD